MDDLIVELATAPTEDVRTLVTELEEDLAARYPPEQRHGLSLDAIFQPHIRFFVARAGGAAVGCAGVALLPDLAEVKRMYVRPAARGRGVAEALLARLEQVTRDAGLTRLCLETGDVSTPRSASTSATASPRAPRSPSTRACRRAASRPACSSRSACLASRSCARTRP